MELFAWRIAGVSSEISQASATYGAAGELSTISYGGYTETRTYNTMGQLTRIAVPGAMEMSYNYAAGQNNGRIAGAADNVSGEQLTYQYDALNRLVSVGTIVQAAADAGFNKVGNSGR